MSLSGQKIQGSVAKLNIFLGNPFSTL